MVDWNKFGRLTLLEVRCRGVAEGYNPVIYGNSRNQAKVIISIGIEDTSEHLLNLNPNDVKHLLYFCDSVTGRRINSPWQFSDDANGYNILANQGAGPRLKREAGLVYVDKYISCSESNLAKTLSVGIDIPGVGPFDTSNNGTTTKNGPKGRGDSTYISPKSFTISTLRPIDYNSRENVIIDVGGSEMFRNNLSWVSEWGKIYTYHNDGKWNRYIARIRPNKSTTGQEIFQKHEFDFIFIENHEINTGTVDWGRNQTFWETFFNRPAPTSKENGFSAISLNHPCAVIGKGIGENYYLNLWYPIEKDSSNIEVHGHFFTRDSATVHYNYKFTLDHLLREDLNYEDGIVKLHLFQFSFPENNIKPNEWRNKINTVTVKVTDLYGNYGQFQLTFDDGENFNKPALKL